MVHGDHWWPVLVFVRLGDEAHRPERTAHVGADEQACWRAILADWTYPADTVEVTAPADAPAVRDVTIDFGDKSRKKSMGALSGRGSVAHVYSNDGSYIVTATVLDGAGRRHASSIGVVVAED